MTLHEAMITLGYDPSDHFKRMLAAGRHEQIRLAQELYDDAKSKAKRLMIKHHPDKGGDPSKFIRVSNCIDTIESETKEFISRCETKIKDDLERRSHQVLISVE